MAGTSMASPLVAGLAGLAFSVARDTNGDGKTNDEVRLAIENGCDEIGITGIGKGRINAYKTISLLMENFGEPSLTGTFGLEQG
jgi:subtilisin family serine protease